MRRISSEIRLMWQIKHRQKKSIFGNPTNFAKRTSSVTFGNLREKPSNSQKSRILPKKTIFVNSTNSANETSSVTSRKIEQSRISSEIRYFGKSSSVEACAEYHWKPNYSKNRLRRTAKENNLQKSDQIGKQNLR